MAAVFKILTLGAGLALMGACSTAPRGAALQSEILSTTAAKAANYQLVMVNSQAVSARLEHWPASGAGLGLNWPAKGQAQGARALRRGDRVTLMIWDSQPNSLLSTPEQRVVAMNNLEISPEGRIFVPYIEEVQVMGLSPEAARAEIQARLSPIAPTAQVQLSVAQGEQNAIDVVAGVGRPGRYPLAAREVTVLAMLAEAGGIPESLRNPVVRLQRGGQSYASLASDLYRAPARDILLRGGDRLVVEADPRSFVVMGASGAESTVRFAKPRHNLLEALSLSGGVAENRADLRAVLVLRQYSPKALVPGSQGPNKANVVFAFDLSDGARLFGARNFDMHPDDVILVTESPLPATGSVLGLFGASLGIFQRLE